MSDRSSVGQRAVRVAAIACSLGLFSFVVLNAQLGCDSPATNAPPQENAAQKPAAQKPAAQTEPKPAPASEPQPAAKVPVNSIAQPEPAPSDEKSATNPAAKPEPVLMPASKSGGDFGSVRFPGERQGQAAQAQQQNPAPNPR